MEVTKGRAVLVEEVHRILHKRYRSPRLENKENALNELLFIQLSLRTTGPSYQRVYKSFKRRFPTWDQVLSATTEEVASALLNAGLANQKANNLRAALRQLKADFGNLSLAALKKWSDEDIEKYLCALPGLGRKSARCIMLYSFDRKVFPVDGHCFRIVKRMGWIAPEKKYNDRVADEIQNLIPLDLRYPLHVNMVAHGRAVCIDRFPKCARCPLLPLCVYRKDIDDRPGPS